MSLASEGVGQQGGRSESAASKAPPSDRPLYNRNNPAKQWIFEQIAQQSAAGPLQLCDLACGDGSAWPAFLKDHPEISYTGVDNDAGAIARARRRLADCANARVFVADAQGYAEPAASFDLVTALSSLEHVVEPGRLVASALKLLKPGGRAYLNYDAGHFRTQDLKERLLVPIGQLLARLGCPRYYLKEIDDGELFRAIEELGGRIVEVRKNNLDIVKRELRDDVLSDAITRAWHDFEAELNRQLDPGRLDPLLWSTVVVVEKASEPAA